MGQDSGELSELLERGPLVLVESDAVGRFASATAIVEIARPADAVWRVTSDFAGHRTFMPKLVASTPTPRGPNEVDVRFEIAIPFPGRNERYTFRYVLDPARREIHGRWVAGDLRDSTCDWRILAAGDARARVHYTIATRNFSKLVTTFEDSQQTVTVGVNVASALAAIKALKARVETGP